MGEHHETPVVRRLAAGEPLCVDRKRLQHMAGWQPDEGGTPRGSNPPRPHRLQKCSGELATNVLGGGGSSVELSVIGTCFELADSALAKRYRMSLDAHTLAGDGTGGLSDMSAHFVFRLPASSAAKLGNDISFCGIMSRLGPGSVNGLAASAERIPLGRARGASSSSGI